MCENKVRFPMQRDQTSDELPYFRKKKTFFLEKSPKRMLRVVLRHSLVLGTSGVSGPSFCPRDVVTNVEGMALSQRYNRPDKIL